MHFGDYTFIFLLALVLFGPKKMPEMGRQLGKLLAEFRRASNEFKFQIQEELRNMEEEERKKKLAESQALAAASEQAMIGAGASSGADAGPTILPPSTGEPVSAARPFAVPVEAPETPSNEPALCASVSSEPIAPESREAIAEARGAPAAPPAAPAPNGAAGPGSDPTTEQPATLGHELSAPETVAESLTHG
ncbi:MAG TPA: twin-arginine translocase TatA/TatE family subunit [Acidobacteriaceae bacterium]|nr:twin-arginine translocase TatA/TatE family subunit [Acidobacteriaceae bacterium]